MTRDKIEPFEIKLQDIDTTPKKSYHDIKVKKSRSSINSREKTKFIYDLNTPKVRKKAIIRTSYKEKTNLTKTGYESNLSIESKECDTLDIKYPKDTQIIRDIQFSNGFLHLKDSFINNNNETRKTRENSLDPAFLSPSTNKSIASYNMESNLNFDFSDATPLNKNDGLVLNSRNSRDSKNKKFTRTYADKGVTFEQTFACKIENKSIFSKTVTKEKEKKIKQQNLDKSYYLQKKIIPGINGQTDTQIMQKKWGIAADARGKTGWIEKVSENDQHFFRSKNCKKKETNRKNIQGSMNLSCFGRDKLININ